MRSVACVLLLLSTLSALAQSSGGVGYVISITGEIEPGLSHYVKRVLDEAQDAGARVVVLDVDTPGGRVDAALEIKDAILSAPLPTVAVVRQAWSAGALISLAAEKIYMLPGSSIGSALPITAGGPGQEPEPAGGDDTERPDPVGEKVNSALRAAFRATAEARGRPADLAEAMVDPTIEVKRTVDGQEIVIDARGRLLNLTGQEAVRWEVADGAAQSLTDALHQAEFERLALERPKLSYPELIARFVTSALVSSLLLSLGFLGLIIELYTPTWGISGTLGAACLALFFFGSSIAGLAGWAEVLLFGLGLALLALEIFVIPGFGVAGVAGIISIVAALVMAFGDTRTAIQALSTTTILVGGSLVLLFRFFPESRFGRKLVLEASEGPDQGFSASEFLGQEGIAQTPLRPAGIVRIGDQNVDVISDGTFIPSGTRVRVVKVEGLRVVVRPAHEN